MFGSTDHHQVTFIKLRIKCVYCVCIAQWSVLLTEYCAGGKIEKNEMGGACGAYGAGERGVQGSGGETWGKETIGEVQTQMGG